MKNKGFTLIELLAVIVILAIIALIATPVILGIIDDARNGASESTAQLVIDNVELAYSTAFMKKNGVEPTIAEVAAAFKMDKATMADTGVITVTGTTVTCAAPTAVTKGSILSITCTANGKEFTTSTASNMKLG